MVVVLFCRIFVSLNKYSVHSGNPLSPKERFIIRFTSNIAAAATTTFTTVASDHPVVLLVVVVNLNSFVSCCIHNYNVHATQHYEFQSCLCDLNPPHYSQYIFNSSHSLCHSHTNGIPFVIP